MGFEPRSFRWLEAPEQEAIDTAWSSLLFLGAVQGNALTEFGRLAAELQLDPAWAKVLFTGQGMGMLQAAADLVGLLSVLGMLSRRAGDEEARKQQNEAQQEIFSDHGDVVMAFRVYEQWLALRNGASGARQRAEEFCRNLWLRPKALELARNMSWEVYQQCRGFFRLKGEEVRDVSAEDLLQLICSGCFLNLVVQCQGRGTAASSQYHLIDVREDAATVVASIFPGSALVRGARPAPKFAIYMQITHTSRTFLSGVTPLGVASDAELVQLLRRFCPAFADLVEQRLPQITSQQVKVPGFSSRMLTGARAREYRLDVQKQFHCTFFSNLREGSIYCWCPPGKAGALKQHLQEHQERLRDADLHHVEEEPIAGNTRAVYGHGGQVAMMLFHDDVLSVNVLDLPLGTAPADLKMSFERYGPVRAVRSSVIARNGSLFSQATFMHKQHAKLALQQYGLDCSLTGEDTFSVGALFRASKSATIYIYRGLEMFVRETSRSCAEASPW